MLKGFKKSKFVSKLRTEIENKPAGPEEEVAQIMSKTVKTKKIKLGFNAYGMVNQY